MSLISGSRSARSITLGCSVCRREKVEQLPRQALAALRRIGDRIEELGLLVAGDVPAQPLHGTAHDHQQIVEIVRDAAGQLSDCLEPLRLTQRVFGELAALRFVVQALGPSQYDPKRRNNSSVAGRPKISARRLSEPRASDGGELIPARA